MKYNFVQHRIVDRQHRGIIAAVISHPQEWRAESRIDWNFQDTSLPVKIYAAAFNPNGAESLEFLPVEAFYWLEPNYGFDAVGQYKGGMTCMPPMDAANAMVRNVIHKYRGNRQNLQIIGVNQIPNLPQILNVAELMQTPSESVVVRIEYDENGRRFEEEFYGVKTQNQASSGSIVQINWGFARLFCCRAEKGNLDGQRNIFFQIAGSVRNNPQWQELYQRILQQLSNQFQQHVQGVYAKLQSEAQFKQQLSAYNQQVRDNQNADISRKIEMDRRRREEPSQPGLTPQERWRNELGGATAYFDPDSSEGNYYYHYGHEQNVWMNERREVFGTDNPCDDPNVGSTYTWKRLKEA
ncbi:MAG TPA: hypothetical protein VF556_11495 [Pyrinomonadaceae bacterium]|jgi:hypothetical protein